MAASSTARSLSARQGWIVLTERTGDVLARIRAVNMIVSFQIRPIEQPNACPMINDPNYGTDEAGLEC